MKNKEKQLTDPKKTAPLMNTGIDPAAILKLITKNWYFFVIAIVLSLVVGRYYILHTIPVYRVYTSVLIFEEESNPGADNDELLKGLGLPGGMRNLENQIKIITSRELTERAVRGLGFEIEYYFKTIRNQIPLYPDVPIEIKYSGKNPLPHNVEIGVNYIDNENFRLYSEERGLDIKAKFGETIRFPDGDIIIICKNKDWFITNRETDLNFVVHSPERLVKYFNSRLNVDMLTRSGSILEISMNGVNRYQDVDFLNELTAVFQDLSLEKKNMEANRRLEFIDTQLVDIRDSLVITENRLTQFRSAHRVMDLSVQGQAIISQVTTLENEKARLNLEANYYDYLADYLEKETTGELPMVPISMGIEDPALTSLVNELANLQEQLSGTGGGEKNPLQNMLIRRVRSKKEELMETLNGLRRANNLASKEINNRLSRVNSQASALPVTERQMLGIERKFKLNDDIYTFLLQKMSELQMQKASNRPDNEVIDPASVMYSQLVAPNANMVYLIALFLGGAIPMLYFYLVFALNNRFRREDIAKLGDLPIVGNIPHIKGNSFSDIFDNPDWIIAESYRLVRSRLQFITDEKKNPVILVTSPMPRDGKTLTAINLAAVYSMLGKKTVLVGFDLRNPKFARSLELNKDQGVSTYLIGKDKVDDIIQETPHKNLFVIASGPIPPNPSELTASSSTRMLFEELKARFEYIIIDTAPVALISDTLHLLPHVDAVLLVARLNKTEKEMLSQALNETMEKNDHVSLLINDMDVKPKRYGYGKDYGYIKETKKGNKKYNRD